MFGETEKFDFKITFFYSSFFFWNKWYNNQKVYLCSKSEECACKDVDKNRILFLSSSINFLEPFDEINNTRQMMRDIIDNIHSFLKKSKMKIQKSTI